MITAAIWLAWAALYAEQLLIADLAARAEIRGARWHVPAFIGVVGSVVAAILATIAVNR